MNIVPAVLPILIIFAGVWVALTFVHPTLAQGAYEVLTAKGGLRLFALCLIIGMLFTLVRKRK